MLNNGVSVLLVVLCMLPNTAPFSSIASATYSTARDTDVRVDQDGRVPPLAVTDNADAMALERSTFLDESRVCSSGLVPSTYGTTAFTPIFECSRTNFSSVHRPACPSVLRV
jgi:hypothetical protein